MEKLRSSVGTFSRWLLWHTMLRGCIYVIDSDPVDSGSIYLRDPLYGNDAAAQSVIKEMSQMAESLLQQIDVRSDRLKANNKLLLYSHCSPLLQHLCRRVEILNLCTQTELTRHAEIALDGFICIFRVDGIQNVEITLFEDYYERDVEITLSEHSWWVRSTLSYTPQVTHHYAFSRQIRPTNLENNYMSAKLPFDSLVWFFRMNFPNCEACERTDCCRFVKDKWKLTRRNLF